MRSDIKNIPNEIHAIENSLRSSTSLPKVYVYVEDDTDIIFWRSLLKRYENKYSFDISTYIIPEQKKIKRKLTQKEFRGKDFMMKDVKENLFSLGKYQIICIDADYDLVIDNYHNYTKLLRESDYIINTYWHSVENFRCSPQNVKLFYELLTLTNISDVDFNKIYEEASKLIYPLLKRLLISLHRNVNEYNICDCTNDIKKINFDSHGITLNSRLNIEKEIEAHADYLARHAKIMNKIEASLSSLEITERNCYLMLQGHCLEEQIVIPMLEYFVEMQRKHRENLINYNYDNEEQREIRLKLYRDETGSYKNLKRQIERMIFECSSATADIQMTKHIYEKLNKLYAD